MIFTAWSGELRKSTLACWMIGTSFLKQSAYLVTFSGLVAIDSA
jgi:hypothetical protein